MTQQRPVTARKKSRVNGYRKLELHQTHTVSGIPTRVGATRHWIPESSLAGMLPFPPSRGSAGLPSVAKSAFRPDRRYYWFFADQLGARHRRPSFDLQAL